MLKRYSGNPILSPIYEHSWESRMIFNCGAIYEGEKVHLVYRARALDNSVSRLGYAVSGDGFKIDKRLESPIFLGDPCTDLECFGVEDPRLTRIGDLIYMCYTGYGLVPGSSRSVNSIQIGMTSISVEDFLNQRWNWSKRWYPFYRVDNKDACLFPEKINGKWVLLHRISPHMWISYSDDLMSWKSAEIVMSPEYEWEYFKIGGSVPPIKTDKGWLLIYHGVSRDFCYRLGLALLDYKNPTKVIWRSSEPFFSPEEPYEKKGVVPNVVFSCGAVVIDGTLFVYYGGADTVIGVATAKLNDVLSKCG